MKIKKNRIYLLFLSGLFIFALSNQLFSQESDKTQFSTAIEDNSFLIEEAYNQETGVVQHISTVEYLRDSKSYIYKFTQEWPIFSYKHQLSYDVPYSFIDSNRVNGLSDVSINYRYQLFYKKDFASVSPRFSIIFPTGDSEKGLGDKAWGGQFNMPISKRLSELFVTHINFGATYLLDVEGENISTNEPVKKNLLSYHVGASIIWLTTSKLNFMFEWITDFNRELREDGEVELNKETTINPGVRYAIDIGNLQIVPGIAVPITFNEESEHEVNSFFYLSFEHSF